MGQPVPLPPLIDDKALDSLISAAAWAVHGNDSITTITSVGHLLAHIRGLHNALLELRRRRKADAKDIK